MKAAWCLCVVLTLMPLPAAPSVPADPPEREVTVANHTRQPMNELYMSSSTTDDWGDDRLGDGMLDPGRTLKLRLPRGDGCKFDLQAVYVDGGREEKHGVDACKTRTITFDGTGLVAPPASSDVHHIAIFDDASRPIQQVFVSPAAASDWGEDLLAGGSISVGDRAVLTYHGGCLADLRVVFNNRGAEERRDLDLCMLGGVRVRPGWTTADTLSPIAPPVAGAGPTAGAGAAIPAPGN